jgi:tetratricopeptide (TPR) repeat protein
MQYLPPYLEAANKASNGKLTVEEKLQIVRDGLATDGEHREDLLAYIAIYLKQLQRYEECIAHCRTELPQMKEKEAIEDIQSTLANALKESGNVQGAIEFRKQMIEDGNDSYFNIRDLIELYEELNDTDNLIKYYKLLEEVGSAEYDEYKKLAELFNAKQQYAESIHYYELAARAETGYGYWMWSEVGRAYALMGDLDEAIFYFKMALKLNPEYAWAHYFIGQAYHNKDDLYRALHHYNEALKAKPDFAEVENNLSAMKFNDEADVQGAIAHALKALAMNPEGPIVTTLYINLARMYAKIADYDKHDYYKKKVMESVGFKGME